MDRKAFEKLVSQALKGLPEEFARRLENVDVVLQDWPTEGQLHSVGLKNKYELLGLYEGVPLTHRSVHQEFTLPDKISIFQHPIEAICSSEEEVVAEIRDVVYHEIAHHFGMSDEHLDALEEQRGRGD